MSFWQQVEKWEIYTLIVCILFFTFYFGKRIDFENIMRKDSPVPMHMGGNVASTAQLKEVTVLDIPDHVYASLSKKTHCQHYLTDNHKWALFVTFPCPGLLSYERAFKKIFQKSDLSEYYRKRVVNVGILFNFYCPRWSNTDEASEWILSHCLKKTCIFNSQRRQVVIDKSLEEEQLPALLEAYKEW
ncbi:MAG: hypothetical protein IKP06_04155 [Elusimicrobiaceae bacterium]|nr:hypothetical protein [Elusimicrobiaceae bacterium]